MISFRAPRDEDLEDLFVWESDPRGVHMAAFTRAVPSDRAASDAPYARVRPNRDVTMRATEDDGALVGMIASFTL